MRRNDLCNKLRQEYQKDIGCGVVRIDDEEYKNVWFVVPPKPPTELTKKLPLKALTKTNQVLNKLSSFKNMDILDKTISYLFVRREALCSSRIEGTWSTIDNILTPTEKLIEPDSKSSTSSIRGYAESLEKTFKIAQKRGYKSINKTLITNLHKVILSKDPQFFGKPGKLRTPGEPGSIVLIGGLGRKESSIYNPTPPQYVDKCLKEVINWYQNELLAEMGDAGMGLPLVARMAIGHVHFEAVHPFSDGNGRVGRMLWPLQMILSNKVPLFLSGFVENQKEEYNRCLNIGQMKLNYIPMIEFMAEAFDASYYEAQTTKSELIKLPNKWRKRGKFRKHSAADKAIDLLIQYPILTANTLSKLLNTSFQSASNALKSLTKYQILRERSGKAKDRIFAAEEVIYLLSRKFADDPKIALSAALAQLKMIT